MGPLKGMKVVEVGGIGPGPFCAQMLADMGGGYHPGGPQGGQHVSDAGKVFTASP